MRILLTGKDGQVGFELQATLAPLGEIVAVDRADCDLADPDAIRALVRQVKPEVIVNPGAYTAVDKAESEPEVAFAINGTAPGILGEEAARINALVVHYSTDYVFDGTSTTPYTETATANPQSIYGKSKLAGEQALQASGADYLIFRTSWVAGAHGANFAKTMLRLAAERDELKVVSDQYGAPTTARLIAETTALILHDAIRRRDDFPYGLYHLVADGETSWYAYASHVIETARRLGKPVRVAPGNIHPIATTEYPTPAQRPANSRLDTTKLRSTFGFRLPDWQQGIDHLLQQLL